MIYEFKLPDIGEGLTEGEVVKWHVKEGDAVKENQPLCNVLTDKAEVEIPSPKSGKVVKLMAQAGQKVKVKESLVAFEVDASESKPQAGTAAAAQTPSSPAAPSAGAAAVSATPAVRKLAADLKADLSKIAGTGPAGRITQEDVRKASGGGAATAAEERLPFIGIRRRTAEKMAQSSRTVAHVTHMDEADFTALAALREELKAQAGQKGVKLTYLPFILRALVKTLKEFPNFNAVLDEAGGHIIRKRYYNVGIATSAEQGLVVPVLKGVDGKDLWTLAGEINALAEKVRAGKVEVSELQGGTFTVTNIGPIGGLFATPIVNHPEVAILGVMKIQKRPAVRDGQIAARDMGNLVLSFDHRVIDGAEAAQFMNMLVKHLENPRTLL
ncbi:MAG: 2-oxo acid dehydrogenase subunit E2 [Elusimicrobia bacterium]|nr:2-oxo acid dehydrogenase subunit E2 [Elusimicrobiota bacterium]